LRIKKGEHMMKKIAIVSLCLLLLGVSIAAAAPGMRQQTTTLDTTGTFDGVVSPRRNGTIVGTMSGEYTLRNRGGRFTGEWATENRTGTFRGGFGKHIILGRISILVNGTEKTLPIVGFIKAQDGQFMGRFMAPVGPALYFWGTNT
jgi:hypothetical protein